MWMRMRAAPLMCPEESAFDTSPPPTGQWRCTRSRNSEAKELLPEVRAYAPHSPSRTLPLTLTLHEVVPVLTALAGVIVGGVIAELRSLLQSTRQRRRALRRLLFELLEVRWSVRLWDPSRLRLTIIEVVRENFGAAAADALDNVTLDRFLRQALGAAHAFLEEQGTGRTYQAAVLALAPHDPLAAYVWSAPRS